MNASLPIVLAPSGTALRGSAPSLPVLVLPALALLAALLALDPSGYRGGGGDDWHYLRAARCAVEAGAYCLPLDHWGTRWTLVAPTAAALAWLGEDRTVLGLVPGLAALGCVLLVAEIARRIAGPVSARLAALLLAATPAFGHNILQPAIDRVELLFLLGAALALWAARDGGGRIAPAILGGLLFSLAVASRPSAIAAAPLLLPIAMTGPRPAFRLCVAALGFAIPLLAEATAYALWIGDPLHPWRLALAHTRIPSSELPPGFPLHERPLLNPRYVDAWRPALGIEAHWTVDPILNLLLHPALGWTLLGATALALAARLPSKTTVPLLAAGAVSFALLVYVFAIDPKPRMFLPLAALASVVAGQAGARLWRAGRDGVVIALVSLLATVACVVAAHAPDLRMADRTAARWLRLDGPHATEPGSAQVLALVPGLRRPVPPDAPVLAFREMPCATNPPGDGSWRVSRETILPLAAHRVLAPRPDAVRLCQWRRVSP